MFVLNYKDIKNKYKNICFLNFDPTFQKTVDLLMVFFSASGFNAFLAADFDGLMGRYSSYRLSYGDPTDPKDELRAELLRHDCFLLPTAFENYGHSISEALLHDCPAVISRGTTPWDDVAQADCGWTVPPELLTVP